MSHDGEGESLSETLDRPVGGPPLRELASILSDDDAERSSEAIEASRAVRDEEIDRTLDELVRSSRHPFSSTR